MRYEIQPTRLAQLLAEAIGRGEPVLVADDDGAPRGFAWYLYSGTLGAGGYLSLIALAPAPKGAAPAARSSTPSRPTCATRARHLFLLVSHWNEGARRFYARRGYAEVGRCPRSFAPTPTRSSLEAAG